MVKRVCYRHVSEVMLFVPSLFVWATVMSCPTEDRAIVDVGLKALAFDSGRRSSATSPPRPVGAPPTSTAASQRLLNQGRNPSQPAVNTEELVLAAKCLMGKHNNVSRAAPP
jgi:D-serine deaminase-like pyridoxal phosphate-dependent protein